MTKVYSITAKLSACSNLTLDFQKCRGSRSSSFSVGFDTLFRYVVFVHLQKVSKLSVSTSRKKRVYTCNHRGKNFRSTSWRITHKRLIIRIYFPSQELLEHSTKRVLKKMFNLLRSLIPLGFYIHAPLLHYMYTSICLVLNKEPQQKNYGKLQSRSVML